MAVILSGSVGSGGINSTKDVKSVQMLLNFWRKQNLYHLIDEDGLVGPITIGAIKLFQKTKFGWANPDGKVDVRGDTLRALNQYSDQVPPAPDKAKGGQELGGVVKGAVWPYSDGSIHKVTRAEVAKFTDSYEHDINKKFNQRYPHPYLSVRVGIAGKLKVSFLDGATEVKIGQNSEAIAISAGQKVCESWTAQIGSSLDTKDLGDIAKLGLAGLVKKFLSAVEMSLEFCDGKPVKGVATLACEVAFNLGSHPVAVKATVQSLPLTFAIPLPGGRSPITTGIVFSGTVSAEAGPTAQFLSRFYPALLEGGGPAAAAIAGAMLSLTALGIWDYGRRLEAADKRLLLQSYVNGYEARILGSQFGLLPTPSNDPQYAEKMRLWQAGQDDAQRDAVNHFSGMGQEPWKVYNYYIWAYAKKLGNSSEYGARQVLRRLIWPRLAEKYPPLDVPRFEI